MKRLTPLLFSLLTFASMSAASPDSPLIPAASPLVRIEGRSAPGPDGRVRLGFPGVTLHLRYRGAALALQLEAGSAKVYFDVYVDRLPPVTLHARPGTGTYPLLADGTADGEHTIAILRRSESWQGTCEIVGFAPGAGGTLLPPPPAKARRLMFIGDSVTSGEYCDYRADDPLGDGRADSHNANAAHSYGAILAQRLGAEFHLVSYGGRGLIRDWQGIRATRNAPQFYELALPDDPAAPWNPSRYVPDAIGVGLGTNDFNQGVPDQNEFVNAYVEFLRKLRRDAPRAWIFLLESPILDDPAGGMPKHAVHAAYLREIVEKLGDPRITAVPVRHYPGVPDNGHPLAAENAEVASSLEPLFRHALGW